MKLLLGILLALVLIEGVAIVGLYLRPEPVQQAALPSAVPQGTVPSLPAADSSGDQSRQLAELSAKVEALQKQLESLQSELRREDVTAALDSALDLQEDAFKNSVVDEASQSIEGETPERWAEYYADLPLQFLEADRDRMTATIEAKSQPEMEARYKKGMAEWMGDGRNIPLDGIFNNPKVITGLFVEPNGMGAFRVSLPRDEFADLYVLKDKEQWLLGEIEKRKK